MLGLKTTLWNSVSGMTTSQAGLSTVGHNIANADTEGYSRQTVQIGNNGPSRIITGAQQVSQGGQGSRVINITRSHSTFLERQLLRDRMNRGFFEGRRDTLKMVESLFQEGNSATLNSGMDTFFNSVRELSQDPSSTGLRQNVADVAQQLASDFNAASLDARRIQEDVDRTIEGRLRRINDLASQIAQINERVGQIESAGLSANDFRDQREQATKEISELVDVRVYVQPNGLVSIDLANGFALVRENISASLRGLPDANNGGLIAIEHTSVGGTVTDITESIKGGEIGGLLDARDNIIPAHMGDIDALAFHFSEEVNSVHRNGFGLDGVDNRDFFTPLGAVQGAAAALQVDPNILNDLDQIAASLDANTLPGDNRNLIELSRVQNSALGGLNNATLNEFYGEVVRSVGYTVANNANFADIHEARFEQSNAMRESIEGVSIDDEMVDLTRFQKHFEASARVMSTVNRLMDELLQLVR